MREGTFVEGTNGYKVVRRAAGSLVSTVSNLSHSDSTSMAAVPVVWSVAAFEGNYSSVKYAIDKQNIVTALARVGGFDIPATLAEENTINGQIPLPHTPDNLAQSAEARAHALCNAGTEAPLKFRAIFKFRDPSPSEGYTDLFIRTPPYGGNQAEYPEWTSVGIGWPSRIHALNRLPLANRVAAQFRFEVVFGNSLQVLNWPVENWMETIIHEVGIHVIQGLHHIDLWRQGRDWPTVDGNGELDHLLFRFSGYRRYNLWRNKMTAVEIQAILAGVRVWDEKEEGRDGVGRDLVKAFYDATAPGNHLPYDFMRCWTLAAHFPNNPNQLVRDANDNTLVDKNQSQAFFDVLRGQLDHIFQYNAGVAAPRNLAFYWW